MPTILAQNAISDAHRKVIDATITMNPATPLYDIAEILNADKSLATLSKKLTPKMLKQLGHSEPVIPATPTPTADLLSNQSAMMTPQKMRSELERTHHKIQQHKVDILASKEMTAKQLDILEKMEKIDKPIRNEIVDLMKTEGAPITAQATIIACMRKLGIAESEINFIEAI